ncbi:hypothetical protein [Rhodopseudomonas palustris]|uniref:hypothetical protein n=1 Tax=Rhodopseudomonas palustris TaxID=1076 RepID=UPI0012ED4351
MDQIRFTIVASALAAPQRDIVGTSHSTVMAGLVPATMSFIVHGSQDMDARDKRGHPA